MFLNEFVGEFSYHKTCFSVKNRILIYIENNKDKHKWKKYINKLNYFNFDNPWLNKNLE